MSSLYFLFWLMSFFEILRSHFVPVCNSSRKRYNLMWKCHQSASLYGETVLVLYMRTNVFHIYSLNSWFFLLTIKTLVESERKFTSAHHQQVILGNWCEAANGQEIFLGASIVIWSWDIEKYSHPTPISNSEEFLTRFILYNYRYTIPPPECWWCRKRFLHIRSLCLLPYILLSPSICPIDVKMSLVAQLKLSKKKRNL